MKRFLLLTVLLTAAIGTAAQDANQSVVLITGSTSGLGREVALRVASTGAHVIVHGRNVERGEAVVQQIMDGGKGSARFIRADLASMDAVRAFAEKIQNDYQRLDVLVNNAGILALQGDRRLTPDGYELAFAVNYLAGFLLTHELMPLLKTSAPSKVINVSSVAAAPLDLDDLMMDEGYSGGRGYGQSKLAQVMFTFDLADELHGTGVTVNALHPASMMDTNMVISAGMQPRTSVDEGAEALMQLVTDDVGTGNYYRGLNPGRAHQQAYDVAVRSRLHRLTARLTGGDRRVLDHDATERVEETLRGFVDRDIHAGIGALIFEKGEEVFAGTFGDADEEGGETLQRAAIHQIYSMTKPIVGAALLHLYDQGAFELDDPVSDYAPEFADLRVYTGQDEAGRPLYEAPERALTIRDLTRHTAGFATGNAPEAVQRMLEEADPGDWNLTLPEAAARLGSVPLWFQPGSQWDYGPSVDVQAFLVERISGVPFRQYLRTHVLDPLGMDETRYTVPADDLHRLPAMYRTEGGERVRVPDGRAYARYSTEWPLTPGSYGLTSTLDDYMRFARMLLNEGELDGVRVLEKETVRLMASNHLSEDITERSWLPGQGQVGFGIDVAVRLRPAASPEEKAGISGEFFWDGAASTLFWVDPANDLAAVLMTQLLPYDSVGLHKAFRDAVYGF